MQPVIPSVASAEFARSRRDHEPTFAHDIARSFASARESSVRQRDRLRGEWGSTAAAAAALINSVVLAAFFSL